MTLWLRETSCNTADASDHFTTDMKQKCLNNDSALVIALKEHIDSLKRKLRDKQFIIESLLGNLQHYSHNNTSISSGNQILVKKRKENIELLCPEVDG